MYKSITEQPENFMNIISEFLTKKATAIVLDDQYLSDVNNKHFNDPVSEEMEDEDVNHQEFPRDKEQQKKLLKRRRYIDNDKQINRIEESEETDATEDDNENEDDLPVEKEDESELSTAGEDEGIHYHKISVVSNDADSVIDYLIKFYEEYNEDDEFNKIKLHFETGDVELDPQAVSDILDLFDDGDFYGELSDSLDNDDVEAFKAALAEADIHV